jgi:hypothetical protein
VHLPDQIRYFSARNRIVADISGNDVRRQCDVAAIARILSHMSDLFNSLALLSTGGWTPVAKHGHPPRANAETSRQFNTYNRE